LDSGGGTEKLLEEDFYGREGGAVTGEHKKQRKKIWKKVERHVNGLCRGGGEGPGGGSVVVSERRTTIRPGKL